MRIIAGEYGGRKINVPPGRNIRPTSDKLRGAIFNILASRVDIAGAQVLDCFCGSGALGLEALSRGADSCVFIDKNWIALRAAKANARDLEVEDGRAVFLQKDALKIGRRPGEIAPAALAFLDPPYNRDLAGKALSALHRQDWLAEGALCIVETEESFQWPLFKMYCRVEERVYKTNKITLLTYTKRPE